jgi:hypothetical protein
MDFFPVVPALAEAPLVALVPALAFAALWWARRRRAAGLTAGAWLAYAAYELGMERRVLCSGECNIRVDLLLLHPALLVLSVVALAAALRRSGPGPGRRDPGRDA